MLIDTMPAIKLSNSSKKYLVYIYIYIYMYWQLYKMLSVTIITQLDQKMCAFQDVAKKT